MSYVPIITQPNTPPSRQTQELADLLGRVVQDYEQSHPTVTGPEVREALVLARRASMKGGGAEAKALAVTLALGVVALVGGVVFYASESGGFELPDGGLVMGIVAIAIVGVFVAFLKRNL